MCATRPSVLCLILGIALSGPGVQVQGYACHNGQLTCYGKEAYCVLKGTYDWEKNELMTPLIYQGCLYDHYSHKHCKFERGVVSCYCQSDFCNVRGNFDREIKEAHYRQSPFLLPLNYPNIAGPDLVQQSEAYSIYYVIGAMLSIIIAFAVALVFYRYRIARKRKWMEEAPKPYETTSSEEHWTSIGSKSFPTTQTAVFRSNENAQQITQDSVYGPRPTLSPEQIEENITEFFNRIRSHKSFEAKTHLSNFRTELRSWKECELKNTHRMKASSCRNVSYRLRASTRLRVKGDTSFELNANIAGPRNTFILAEEPINNTVARTYLAALHHNVTVMLMAGEMDRHCTWVPEDPPILVKHEKDVDVIISNEQSAIPPEQGIQRTQLMVRSDAQSLGPTTITHFMFTRLKQFLSLMRTGRMESELITPIALALNEILPLPGGHKMMIFSRDGTQLPSLLAVAVEMIEAAMEGQTVDPFDISRRLRFARNGAYHSPEGFAFSIFLALKTLSLRLKNPTVNVYKFLDKYEADFATACKCPIPRKRLRKSRKSAQRPRRKRTKRSQRTMDTMDTQNTADDCTAREVQQASQAEEELPLDATAESKNSQEASPLASPLPVVQPRTKDSNTSATQRGNSEFELDVA